jgi:hypothetical protein
MVSDMGGEYSARRWTPFCGDAPRTSEAVGVKTRSSVRPAICTRSGAVFGPRGLDRNPDIISRGPGYNDHGDPKSSGG